MFVKDDGLWRGVVVLHAGDEFKVRANGAWDLNYGITDGAAALNGGNIVAEADGTYLVTLDPNADAPTLTVEKIAWSAIGAIGGTNWDTDFPMTEDEPGFWMSEAIELHAGEELKVRGNNDWTVNFGLGEDGKAAQDGSNVKVETDGKYIVMLDLLTMSLSIEAAE